MEILTHIHSIWRWVVLVTAVLVIVRSVRGFSGKLLYTPADKKAGSLFVMSLHIQFLIGISVLVMGSTYIMFYTDYALVKTYPKETRDLIRFFALEHPLMMFIATILATIGNARAKKAANDVAKHKTAMIFFMITVVIILAMIPWPFLEKFSANNGWF